MKKIILGLVCLYSASTSFIFSVPKINISGLNKKRLLNALYQRAQTQGLGVLHYKPNHSLSGDEAAEILQRRGYIDYLHGRVMKIDLSGDFCDTRLYNRDNGDNAAEEVIKKLRSRE